MAVDPIPPRVRKVWDEWNMRGVMLFSLSMQTFLILFAPWRKGTANKLIIMLLWSVYLLADWAANFAVGLISDSQGDTSDDPSIPPENNKLLAFWPPFLLLHLGGPDTITAFALEDNELWLRHLLGLIFQAVAAIYVFLQALSTQLTVPTILMFFAGTIKYLERTRALYLASLDRFRDSMLKEPDPGPNYAKLMDEYYSKIEAKHPAKIITIEEPDRGNQVKSNVEKKAELENVEVVERAYYFFKIFKGLIVDLIFSFHERDESCDFFKNLNPEYALRVIEVELNFVYEVFYTKIQVVHSAFGYVMRLVSFGLVVASLSLFHFHAKKNKYADFDVKITYVLFWGAIGLDTIALIMLIFSDWTFAALKVSNNAVCRGMLSVISWFLVLKKPQWYLSEKQEVLATPFLFRRWCGYVSGYNLVRYCLKGRPVRIYKVKNCFRRGIEKLFRKLKIDQFVKICLVDPLNHFGQFLHGLVSGLLGFIRGIFTNCCRIPVLGQICNGVTGFIGFIFEKIVSYLGLAIDFAIEFSGLTDFVDAIRYVSKEPLMKAMWKFIFDELKRKSDAQTAKPELAKEISSARGNWILEKEYKEYSEELLPYVNKVAYDESLLLWHVATELLYQSDNSQDNNDREFSKTLSDYMLYLLVMQPGTMSAVAGIGKIRFRDTCAEVKRFLNRKGLKSNEEEKACNKILEVNTYVKPITVKGDRSKSVLFDASMLAKALRKLDGRVDKWKLLSEVWVEMLSYAACNCDAITHAQQVSKGGEFITFVWLLMAHLGLGNQFQINKGQGRAKLIVNK